jgi:ABC-type sugar transport system substrate-binding protein
MNTRSSSTHRSMSARRASRMLAVFSVIALALAASPTALAKDRGRPGALGVQQANLDQFFSILRTQLRSVSWSD